MSPQEVLLRELTRAAGAPGDGRGRGPGHREVSEILTDPSLNALDRLLIDDQTVHDHPELLKEASPPTSRPTASVRAST